MTGGADRTETVVVAVVISLVVHALAMFFIRPQVMTRVTPSRVHHSRREPMTVRDAVPPPEAIRIGLLKDLTAPQDEPAADAEDPLPAAAADAVAETADETAPTPEAIPIADAPARRDDVPVFMDKVEIVTSERSTSPLAASGPMTVPAIGSEPSPVVAAKGEFDIPMFAAPAPKPSLPEAKIDAQAVRMETVEARATDGFKPAVEVYAEVDEKVVEQEKAAVRALLNDSTAGDLSAKVNCRLSGARIGDWTYFKVSVTPKPGELNVVPKDVVVLLDASGSIGTDRLVSCRNAAKRILRTAMNTGDRFNLVAFRNSFSYAFRAWQPCGATNYEAADRWLSNLAAHGRTDVFSTIRSVLTLPRDPKRPLVAVVVTDGDANSGVSETAQIISRFSALNDGLVSVYMYGVRGNANVELIDVLTRGNRGESVIHEGTRWRAGEGLEGLAERFRDPVVTDLRVVFPANSRVEAYPRMLKNLYLGNSVEIVGRIPAAAREIAFSLRGIHGAKAYESFFRLSAASAEADVAVPQLWLAERDIEEKAQGKTR